MFGKKEVEDVINELANKVKFFVSEAHFQMSFIEYAIYLFNKTEIRYTFIPEYPFFTMINGKEKRDEIDLLIIDNEDDKKTIIEFKHKTANNSCSPLNVRSPLGYSFKPSSMGAQDLGRFDCWSDIERIIMHKKCKEVACGFFIFVTNDELYWTKSGTNTYGCDFGINESHYVSQIKCWKKWNDTKKTVDVPTLNSISPKRNRTINIQQNLDFAWNIFTIARHSGKRKRAKDRGTYKQLIVEI